MLRTILSRVALAIPVLFIMTVLTFVFASLVPGSAATVILGENATGERIKELNDQLGLNQPIWTQYLLWVGHLFQGNLGVSLYSGEPVTRLIGERIWPTLSLAVLATLVSGVVGVAFGVIAAVKRGWVARVLDALGMLGISFPNFWVAILLIQLFAGVLHWLPPVGYTSPSVSVGQWLLHLIMPIIALALAGVALIAKQARETMTEALSRDFMRFMQANGVPRRRLIMKYGLRYAALPIASTISATFITLMGGTVVLEGIFAIPGTGSLVATGTLSHDLSVIQGAVLVFTIVILIANVVTDIVYSVLNPKVGAR